MREHVRRVASLASLGAILVFAFLVQASISTPAATTSSEVKPNAVNMLDCNGYSPIYKSVKRMGALCTDFFRAEKTGAEAGYDNGHYIGHDEPTVKFISSTPNSGNHMTYNMTLSKDPVAAPTANGSVTHYAELSPAPWFGLPICDPKSYPMNPCKKNSDTNTGAGAPTDAGSAFMELQFYAPGFGPFKDAPSCDQTKWCAALTIDSLECTFQFTSCNNNCIEPINFAYLQLNGVPAGPPSPQLINDASFDPNASTLKMNPGDRLRVTLQDTAAGFKTTIKDLNTGQTGFMVASSTNGFMNTTMATCGGTPFSFHPEYNTASKQNMVPWAALEGGVLMQDELGHFEPCTTVSTPIGISYDAKASWVCNGGLEPNAGEGPCNTSTGVCTNATTEGGGPCPSNNFTSGNHCEYSDAICAPKGPRTVVINGVNQTWNWGVAGCQQNYTQNGDLDFDGTPYHPDWPDGSASHPTSFTYTGPLDPTNKPYPSVQFETDLGGSEANCNTTTGTGCTVPPTGASFYPFWSIGKKGTSPCQWYFGNTIPGTTTNNFGGDAQYGSPDIARFGGTFASAVLANPQITATCT